MSATGRGPTERLEDDAYETPRWCVARLLDRIDLPTDCQFVEPCAGTGKIIRAVWTHPRYAERMDAGWIAVEKRPECLPDLEEMRARGDVDRFHIGDFLTWAKDRRRWGSGRVVLTNPPYSLAREFLLACLPAVDYVVFLLRLNWLASQERHRLLSDETPDVYVLPNRPQFIRGTNPKTNQPYTSDATEYAWFVWGPDRHRRRGTIELLDATPPWWREGENG